MCNCGKTPDFQIFIIELATKEFICVLILPILLWLSKLHEEWWLLTPSRLNFPTHFEMPQKNHFIKSATRYTS